MKVTAELCYTQHGGSGFTGFSPESVAAMDLDQIDFYLEWLDRQRSREAEAIRKANQGAR